MECKKKLQRYKVPVVWSMWGKIEVVASSKSEAIERALDSETPLPKGNYLEDSIEFDDEGDIEISKYEEDAK